MQAAGVISPTTVTASPGARAAPLNRLKTIALDNRLSAPCRQRAPTNLPPQGDPVGARLSPCEAVRNSRRDGEARRPMACEAHAATAAHRQPCSSRLFAGSRPRSGPPVAATRAWNSSDI